MINFTPINKKSNDNKQPEVKLNSYKDAVSNLKKSNEKEGFSKEIEEAKILKYYKEALEHDMKNDYEKLFEKLNFILTSSLLKSKNLSNQLLALQLASYRIYARACKNLKDYENALIFYKASAYLDKQDFNSWFGCGIIALQLKDWDESIEAFERAHLLNKRHWPSLENLIILHLGKANFERCIDLCVFALEIDNLYEVSFYALQKINIYHKSLFDYFHCTTYSWSEVMSQEVSESVKNIVDARFNELRAVTAEKTKEKLAKQILDTVPFKCTLKDLTWECLTRTLLNMYNSLKLSSKEICVMDVSTLITEDQLKSVEPKSPCVNTTETNISLMTDADDEEMSVKSPSPIDSNGELSAVGVKPNSNEAPLNEENCKQSIPRKTRNSYQLMEPTSDVTPQHIQDAMLLRNNINWEIFNSSNIEISTETDKKKEEDNSNAHEIPESFKSIDKLQGESTAFQVVQFVKQYFNTKPYLLRILYDLERHLAQYNHLLWSDQLIDDYLVLWALLEQNTQDYPFNSDEESPQVTIQLIIRDLFYMEMKIDRIQSCGDLKFITEKPYLIYILKNTTNLENRLNYIFKNHSREFYKQLQLIEIRYLWLSFVFYDIKQNDNEAKNYLLKAGVKMSDYRLYSTIRVNCKHHSLMCNTKINDYFESTSKIINREHLDKLYQEKRYQEIVDSVKNSISKFNIPTEDYLEEIDSNIIVIDYQAISMKCLLNKYRQSTEADPTQSDDTRISISRVTACYNCCVEALCAMGNFIDIIVDPEQRQYSRLTDKQTSCLTANYFSVVGNILDNVALCFMFCESNAWCAMQLFGEESLCKFTIVVKEYFYHLMYMNKTDFTPAHILTLYTHYKILETSNPSKFNKSLTNNPSEELDYPPSLNFLYYVHEYLSHKGICRQHNGQILVVMLRQLVDYLNRIRPQFKSCGGYIANRGDCLTLLYQVIYCLRPITKPNLEKIRQPELHRNCSPGNDCVTIDLKTVDLMLPHILPDRQPEFDSLKNMSITAELFQFLLEIISLLPDSIFNDALPLSTINELMMSDEPLCFTKITANRYSKVFYLVADYYFKTADTDKSLSYYQTNLRFSPICFDSWAACSLVFYQRLEKEINLANLDVVDEEDIKRCFNCFKHAYSLDSDNTNIVTEMTCFCFDITSYCSRILKKSLTREIAMSHLNFCSKWRDEMMTECISVLQKLSIDLVDNYEERWLVFYLLAKCYEKSADRTIFQVVDCLETSLDLLDKCGAKYAKRIIIYSKLPHYSVEAVELYYKFHASILKVLYKNRDNLLDNAGSGGDNSRSRVLFEDKSFKKIDANDLKEIFQRLLIINKTPFIENVGKRNKKDRKRSNNATASTGIISSRQIDDTTVDSKYCKVLSSPSREDHECPSSDCITISSSRCKPIFLSSTEDTEDDDCMIIEPTTVAVMGNNPLEQHGQLTQNNSIAITDEDEAVSNTQEHAEMSKDNSPDNTLLQTTAEIYQSCITMCKNAMEVVLQRLPMHHKALFHLAKLYSENTHYKNLDTAYEYLMGSINCEFGQVTGIFKGRKSSNFYHNVWRIPVRDIDRCGSFSYHNYTSTLLLLTILRQTCNWRELIKVNESLRNSINMEKKGYLSQSDRQVLIRKSLGHALICSNEWLANQHALSQPVSKPDLLMIYQLYAACMKQAQGIDQITSMLYKAFIMCHCAIYMFNVTSSNTTAPSTTISAAIDTTNAYTHQAVDSSHSDLNQLRKTLAQIKDEISAAPISSLEKILNSMKDSK